MSTHTRGLHDPQAALGADGAADGASSQSRPTKRRKRIRRLHRVLRMAPPAVKYSIRTPWRAPRRAAADAFCRRSLRDDYATPCSTEIAASRSSGRGRVGGARLDRQDDDSSGLNGYIRAERADKAADNGAGCSQPPPAPSHPHIINEQCVWMSNRRRICWPSPPPYRVRGDCARENQR